MKKEQIMKLRNELYESLPTGEVHAFTFVKIIKNHIRKLDILLKQLDEETKTNNYG